MTQPALQFSPEVIADCEQIASLELTLTEQAAVVMITDESTAVSAGGLLSAIRARRKIIKDTFAPLKAAAHASHRYACDLESKADLKWSGAEVALKLEIARWDEVCERERQALEREAAAERARQEAHQRKAAELERARLQKEEDDKQLEIAAIAESVGDTEGAARILAHAPVVPMPELAPVMPAPIAVAPQAKVPGASVRKVWRHTITNPKAVVRAFLVPDEKAIAAIVKSLGPDAVAVVGGITVHEERQVAGRVR